MEWTTLLIEQQTDFLQRLKSGHLLHCETEGHNSELTVISGERLKKLREFCWEMVDKYRTPKAKDSFINNMKGKLAEEVVKDRLGNLVTEVDYVRQVGGDGKIDFTLVDYPDIGIQVKARHGNIDTIKWSFSKKEIEKNAVLVCILIQQKVCEAENKYNLILAGFLPTPMVEISNDNVSFRIDELLYSGGLHSYLKSLISYKTDSFQSEISRYNSALKTLCSSIITQLIQDEDFIGQSKNLIEAKLIGRKDNAYDRRDGLIEGSVIAYQITEQVFSIKEGDIYDFRWTISFKLIGDAIIGYVNSDGEHGENCISCLCEGNVEITLPDSFCDYFLVTDSIGDIIKEIVSSIELKAEIHSASFD